MDEITKTLVGVGAFLVLWLCSAVFFGWPILSYILEFWGLK